MGTVKVTIGVGDPQGRQFEELDVTVDTGSTYTAGKSGQNAPSRQRNTGRRVSLPKRDRRLRRQNCVPVDVGEATIRNWSTYCSSTRRSYSQRRLRTASLVYGSSVNRRQRTRQGRPRPADGPPGTEDDVIATRTYYAALANQMQARSPI